MVDEPAPPPAAPIAIRTAAATVGQTAIGGSAVVSISAILSWGFDAVINKKLSIPNEQTLAAMSLGLILVSHGIEKFFASLRSKKRRAGDITSTTSGA